MSEFRIGQFDRKRVPRWAHAVCPAHARPSLLEVDLHELAKAGKRLILLDVDNTLLPWRSEDMPAASIEWVKTAKAQGLELCILSNTRHPARLERLAKKLDVPFLRGKFKPNPAMYRQALKQFGLKPEQAVMIGDQLFTDILGANRAGIEAIWVCPMTSRDFVGTKLSRLGERIVRGVLYRGLMSDSSETSLPVAAEGFFARPVVRQFIKFCIVGGTSTVVDVGLHGLFLFVIPWGHSKFGPVFGEWLMSTFPAIFGGVSKPMDAAFPVLKVFSASLAILNSFYWNRRWTFRIRGKEKRMRQLQKFVVVAVIGMVLNTVITTGLYNVIPGHPRRSWAVATAIATVIVAFWNFGGQKLWTFRHRHDAPEASA